MHNNSSNKGCLSFITHYLVLIISKIILLFKTSVVCGG